MFVTRKVLILLLANTNAFFSTTCITRLVNLKKTATFQAASDVWHNWLRFWSRIQQVIKKLPKCIWFSWLIWWPLHNDRIELIKLDADIYQFFVCSEGILMFIHRFRRDLVKRNSYHSVLYRSHMQPSNPVHVFSMKNSGSHSQIYNSTYQSLAKTRELLLGQFLRVGVFHLLLSNPSRVEGTQHLSVHCCTWW